MVHFSYCLSVTFLHSIWQAALLLCLYLAFNMITVKNHPVIKRNILLSMLLAQVILSASTFFIYYTGTVSVFADRFFTLLPALSGQQPFAMEMGPWLILVYTVIFMYKMIRMVSAWLNFRNQSRYSRIKPSTELKLFTTLKAYQFGIRRKVKLWYSNNISSPVTFGFFRPVIILPLALVNNLSIAETETLIIHELTHIRNNDYFLNWLLVICETVFFFNPFIRGIGNRIRLEREKNCDTHVLQFEYPAISYAETLLKAATMRSAAAPIFLAAAMNNPQLLTRISFFIKEKNLLFHKRNYTGFAVVLTMLLIFFNLFVVNNINHKKETAKIAEPAMALYKDIAGNDKQGIAFKTAALPIAAKITPAKHNNTALHNKPVQHTADASTAAGQVIPNTSHETEPVNIAVVPVAFSETGDTKQITLREESSETGRSVTKVFEVKLINGEWKSRLLMTITETRPSPDSGRIVKDTTGYFNPVQ